MQFANSSECSEHDVASVVKALRGKSMVEGHNAEEGTVPAGFSFLELWVPCVIERQKIQLILDLFLVAIAIGQDTPATLAATVARYPRPGSPHPALLPVNISGSF
jgi:hypothetical protein